MSVRVLVFREASDVAFGESIKKIANTNAIQQVVVDGFLTTAGLGRVLEGITTLGIIFVKLPNFPKHAQEIDKFAQRYSCKLVEFRQEDWNKQENYIRYLGAQPYRFVVVTRTHEEEAKAMNLALGFNGSPWTGTYVMLDGELKPWKQSYSKMLPADALDSR